ncbi:hypothetical protein P5G51_014655 [Virgibacillus sp. 179-BFC.A HS]|uniref:Uncharacterized protein n=1 Tax=Tigheibacillus jepli TaxID=3035914 RepID=A0ABU5CKJ8_9BACI|nr:hypothetical protein [Virgibacillus sp. 179-BFC.A HS]MDY0406451.1 hypothetical protein [Virgibacillus sp. 179-BFC.A HS]
MYQCKDCHQYKDKGRIDISKYRCGKCKGKLKMIRSRNTNSDFGRCFIFIYRREIPKCI